MGRTVLVTVPDEGAAWIVRDALGAGGVTCEVEGVRREHPYAAGALAREMRIFVADEQLAEARRLLAGLEGEVANEQDELAAEAMAAGRTLEEAARGAPTAPQGPPKLRWALALGLLVPLPVVCYYARVRWLCFVFVVTFFVTLAYAAQELEEMDLREALGGWSATTVLLAVKVADLLLGLGFVLARRRDRR
jgi:hypothetical protein